jgi:thioesterase domain-containing protein
VFAEVLELPRVGLGESFFELGGHSLLLPRLTERLERRLGRRVPLARIYAAPTVEALSETLESGAPQSPLLVPFEFPAHGPTFFCVHPGGGGASVYQGLARHLAPEVRLVGVQAVGLTDDEPPLRSIESMARRYVAALREAQPEGPYHLGGWSFGGLVAFEMAAQLAEAGAQVATLALIDTLPPAAIAPSETDPRVFMALFARLAGLEMQERDLAAFSRDEALEHVAETVARFTPAFGAAGDVARLVSRVVTITEIALSSIQRFEPRAWHGGGCVLLQAENADEAVVTGALRDGAYGWPALVPGGLTVERLPGSHESVVGEPHVRALARALRLAVTRSAGGPTASLSLH